MDLLHVLPMLADDPRRESFCRSWSRTNGVNTNGAAATVSKFDRMVKKVRPGAFGKIKAD